MSAATPGGTSKPYSDEDKIHLFLAYFGLLSLVPFLMYKDKRSDPAKEYVYWHGRQGLALSISVIAVAIVVGIFLMIVSVAAPVIGGIFGCLLWVGFLFVVLGAHIMGWVKAFGGEKWEIPVVCKVAEMLN